MSAHRCPNPASRVLGITIEPRFEYIDQECWPPVDELDGYAKAAELEHWQTKYSSKAAPVEVIARMDALEECND